MIVDDNRSLPVVRVADIVTEENPRRWMIDPLWGASAVGVIGGPPKCSKTWLALDISLSVATGTACLDRYEVPRPGPVLVYLAEDSLAIVRERVEGIARHRSLPLDSVPLHVITAPVLRLDRQPHRTQLLETARRLRPRLVLLDPLVRLHGIDENHAGEVAQLLAYFRSLQRELDLSVILVHHTRKNAAGGTAAGLGLRGSSDIHAFGDSNLYLRRTGERLLLSSEHRAAAAARSVYLELVATDAKTTASAIRACAPPWSIASNRSAGSMLPVRRRRRPLNRWRWRRAVQTWLRQLATRATSPVCWVRQRSVTALPGCSA